MPVETIPAPWVRGPVFAVGGLFQVGFASSQDLLLVHSSQGRGLFDAVSGIRLARDYVEPMDTFDRKQLTAAGFDVLEGQSVRMAGLFGGCLVQTTVDKFWLEENSPEWPARRVIMTTPDRSRAVVGEDGPCELRAFGFSDTGRSFVIATSCELMLFKRCT